ncbi:uncharacterized protein IUM83_10980 [Phytophthora cinnamomi]|uniref:uncharacterized protein n=1 Tax=Phytophthora cinnamomi TaxID=4785 RepID=UPI00355944EF|nr:hypothetical protein IUM83_10980 [Phytophthora cinnamomi]
MATAGNSSTKSSTTKSMTGVCVDDEHGAGEASLSGAAVDGLVTSTRAVSPDKDRMATTDGRAAKTMVAAPSVKRPTARVMSRPATVSRRRLATDDTVVAMSRREALRRSPGESREVRLDVALAWQEGGQVKHRQHTRMRSAGRNENEGFCLGGDDDDEHGHSESRGPGDDGDDESGHGECHFSGNDDDDEPGCDEDEGRKPDNDDEYDVGERDDDEGRNPADDDGERHGYDEDEGRSLNGADENDDECGRDESRGSGAIENGSNTNAARATTSDDEDAEQAPAG